MPQRLFPLSSTGSWSGSSLSPCERCFGGPEYTCDPLTPTWQLTPDIKAYVSKKVGNALSKVGRRVTHCECTLKADNNPHTEKLAQAEVAS